jgi:hypothetical protein
LGEHVASLFDQQPTQLCQGRLTEDPGLKPGATHDLVLRITAPDRTGPHDLAGSEAFRWCGSR